MSDHALGSHLDKAERALARIEQAARRLSATSEREERLKATVRDVVAELDSLIAGGSR